MKLFFLFFCCSCILFLQKLSKIDSVFLKKIHRLCHSARRSRRALACRFQITRKINENFMIFIGYSLCFFTEKQPKLINMKRVPPMLFYRKTAKIDKYEKGTPYAFLSKNSKNWQIWEGYPLYFFIEKQPKLINMRRVPPMLFYRKTAKIDKYEKGTPYVFLSKNSKNFSYLKFFVCNWDIQTQMVQLRSALLKE